MKFWKALLMVQLTMAALWQAALMIVAVKLVVMMREVVMKMMTDLLIVKGDNEHWLNFGSRRNDVRWSALSPTPTHPPSK